MSNIVVNTRNLSNPITGVQRYTRELLSRFGDSVDKIAPAGKCEGVRGHMWEQFVLPARLRDKTLWSPSNTGPLAVKRQVVTIHDMVTLDHPEWMNKKFATWYGWLLPKLIHRAARVITDSEFTRQRILQITGVKADKVVMIPLGVDSRFFPRPPDEIENMRKHLAIPTANYCLSVGSLEPRKNLRRLLQAWNLAQRDLPADAWLVLAGGKGKALVFQDYGWENLPPRVHWACHVDDAYLPALYSGARVFIYISLYEGFGLPPLEAMACGIPVVASSIPPLHEVCADAASMVDPVDVDSIAQHIRHTFTVKATGQKSAEVMARAACFRWEKTAKATWDVLTAI